MEASPSMILEDYVAGYEKFTSCVELADVEVHVGLAFSSISLPIISG